MSVIQLLPREAEAPSCERYDDERAVRTFEREVRQHRGQTEPFRLERRSLAADCTWYVSGASGSEYAVDVVDGATLDACECPDFLTSGLGTCKHLEAVRRALDKRPKLRRALEACVGRLLVPTLTVRIDGAPRLVAAGTWSARQLRANGLSHGEDGALEADDVDALAAGDGRLGVRVTHAAVRFARERRIRRRLQARREELQGLVDAGRLGLEVLTQPLFPYQREGVRFLVSAGRALLADDMGLGKTVQALAACELLRLRGEARRVLVVTSASLKDQWAREIARYARSEAVVVSGGTLARRAALEGDAPYKILNYELTWRELTSLQDLDADVLILDEAQRAKNFRTKTAMTLRSIPSRYLFVLTGTPIENRLDDLYALLQLVDPAVLGPLWRFNLAFHQQNERGRVLGYKNLSGLRAVIAPVVLRRRKEEVLSQLPALTEQTRYLALTARQRELEQSYRQAAAGYLALAERRPLTLLEQQRLLAALLKARQACNSAYLCDRKERACPKLDELESLLSEVLAQGTSKVLVFSEWVEMLKLAAERLEGLGIGYGMLHGGVPVDRRPALLQRFREDPAVRVLLATDAGGTGLNLQAASYVVHLDLPWNPGRLDQRTARAHRLGQTRGVSVTYLCAESGIERGIEGTLRGKRAIRSAALELQSDVETLETPSFTVFLRQVSATLQALEKPDDTEDDGSSAALVEGAAQTAEAVATAPTHEPSEEGAAEVALTDETASHEAPTLAPEAEVDTVSTSAEGPPEGAPGVLISASALEGPEAGFAGAAAEASAPAGEGVDASQGRDAPPAGAGAAGESSRAPGTTNRGAQRASGRLRLARVVLEAGFPADAVRASYESLGAAITGLLEGPAPQGHGALVAAIYRELIPSGRLPPAAHAALARLQDLASLEAHGLEVPAGLAAEAVAEAAQWCERLGCAE